MLSTVKASRFFSGTVDAKELKRAFETMDVHVTEKEVELLLKRSNVCKAV